MKRIVTAELVEAEFAAGQRHIDADARSTVVTPEAWSRAHELGVAIGAARAGAPANGGASSTPPRPSPPGGCERTVDASGIVRVSGQSVRLGHFEGAGPGRDVRLLDLVTAKDGAPMTAGIMSWRRADSFPWALDYDEVDFVLSGVLEVTVDGRVIEARAGDVVYLPKGSRIIFGTPNHVRVFYVTYPADWTAAAHPPPRPQR